VYARRSAALAASCLRSLPPAAELAARTSEMGCLCQLLHMLLAHGDEVAITPNAAKCHSKQAGLREDSSSTT